MECWNFMKCGMIVYKNCPAYPDYGLDCWKVTGTKCNGGTMEKATKAEKIEFCKKCDFYKTYAHRY